MTKNKRNIMTIFSAILNFIFIMLLVIILIKKGPEWYQQKIQRALHMEPINTAITLDDNTYNIRKSMFYTVTNAKEQNKIVFLGDSLTQNCNWDELFQNQNIINRGIMSDTTKGVLERLDDIIKLKPKKIFLMIGINDLHDKSIDVVSENYSKILSVLEKKLPGTKIYVQSVLPINNNINKYDIRPETIINLNAKIKKTCGDKKIQYINLYDKFKDNDNMLLKKYTIDGTHLNGKGYLVWKQTIEKYVNMQ
jgi:lysophospholipase L1-like esterase